jgi:tetratricopeptide (TPR) repeat protein
MQAVKRWLQTHSEWLLILDNADELALVPEFLPPTQGGHLLLMTRAQALGRLASRIEVEMFSAEQGALAAAQLIETYHIRCSEAGSLLDKAGRYFEGGARFQEAQQLYEHAVHFWEQLLGLEHPDVATKLNRLAHLYVIMQGKDVQAKALYQRALRILEHSEHPDRADALVGLASIYRRQGKDAQAESLYRRALEIRERQLGRKHPEVASSLNNLASLYNQQGKQDAMLLWCPEKRIGLLQKLIADCERHLMTKEEEKDAVCPR